MASLRYYFRRVRRIAAHPAAQLLAVGLLLFFALRWVIEHNHDDDRPYAPLARPVNIVESPRIDWTKLAFVQYATSPEYLCNALMIWSQIEEQESRSHAQSPRVMLYPSAWDPNEIDDTSPSQELHPVARLLQTAVKTYNVTLYPVTPITHNTTETTWSDSLTKLLIFNLTQYSRLVYLDSDSLYRRNMDELFLIQPAPIAMPWVYWGESQGWSYSSQLMVVTPSTATFSRIEHAIAEAGPNTYDMDLLHSLFPPTSSSRTSQLLRIPARPYNLLSGEFRLNTHSQYLSTTPSPVRRRDEWDPDTILAEARFLHFSDWPVPKPWMRASKEVLNRYMPKCKKTQWFGATNCRDRTVWLGLYQKFAETRKQICGVGFELQEAVLPEDSVLVDGKWWHPDEVG